MGKHIFKQLYISFFLLIIFTPLVSSQIQDIFNINLDRKLFGIRSLAGFTDKIDDSAPLTVDNYISSKFQRSFTERYEQNMPFKKVLVKAYNTLQFILFDKLNRSTDMILGKDNNIYTEEYIFSLLALGSENDYSNSKNLDNLRSFIDDLLLLQEKLEEVGKFLYVYIPPGKSTIQGAGIPNRYFAIRDINKKDVVTAFDEIASKTKLNYWLAKDLELDPNYPPFYKTGIHWSRVYEQKATQKIIEDIKRISKNPYRNIVLNQVRKRQRCFWRDCDMIYLSNAWIDIPQDYYAYQIEKQTIQDYKPMKFLIYGDSFSLGLTKDILVAYPEEKLYHTTRNDLFAYNKERVLLKKDFNNVDYKKYLDESDGVIIEMTEPEIKNYTYGFVKHLIKILNEAN